MRRSTSRSSQADRRTGGQTLWFALLVLSASPPIRLSAQELANNAGALFLLFPVGAQAVAMGQTAATLDGHGVTHALDVGGQFTVGPAGALRVGVAVRNVGFKLQVNNRDQADALPARLVVGAAYRILLPGAPGLARAERLDVKLAADVDSPWGSYGESEMRLGIDVGYQRLLRLRGGYAVLRDGLSALRVRLGGTGGSIGVDLARAFLTGSDLVAQNPTFFSFRVVF